MARYLRVSRHVGFFRFSQGWILDLTRSRRGLDIMQALQQALGCLYVLEGSTLGGQVVTRYLAGVPSMEDVTWFSFFSSYGAEVGPMWQEFGEFLTVHARGDDEAIVRAACETFTTLACWLRCEELVSSHILSTNPSSER